MVAVVAAALVAPTLAAAEPGPPARREAARAERTVARTAVVEIVETGERVGERRVVFTLAIAEDDRVSRVETHDGGADYRIAVRRWSPRKGTALVQLDLRRFERRAKGRSSDTGLSMTSRIKLGQRSVLGKIERSGGGVIEVAVTLE
jgi:hypothetical protein